MLVGGLGWIVARANVEEAREDRSRVNNVVYAGMNRVDHQHEQTGRSGKESDRGGRRRENGGRQTDAVAQWTLHVGNWTMTD